MTKKTLKRQLQESAATRAKRVMYALEAMGSAYARATNLDPTKVCLMTEELPLDEQLKTGQRVRYWYAAYERSANIQDSHPDIKVVFTYAMDLVKANAAHDVPAIQALLDGLTVFMEKYDDAQEADTEGGTELSDAGRTPGGTSEDGTP